MINSSPKHKVPSRVYSPFKPGSHLCDKHNTSDISRSRSTRKKEHVPFFLCFCLCLCRLCYAYRTSVKQALQLSLARMYFVKVRLFYY